MNPGNKEAEVWLEIQMENKIKESLLSPSSWAHAESMAMSEYLKIYLPGKECCEEYWKGGCGNACLWTKKSIADHHVSNSFASEECTVLRIDNK